VPPPKHNLPHSLALAGATILEVAAGIFKFKPPLSRSGVAFFSEDRRFSWQKAHDELGYAPQFDLQTGIGKTVAWYKEQGLLN
jgi:nucleoside-diphosphate-sugar epimerase